MKVTIYSGIAAIMLSFSLYGGEACASKHHHKKVQSNTSTYSSSGKSGNYRVKPKQQVTQKEKVVETLHDVEDFVKNNKGRLLKYNKNPAQVEKILTSIFHHTPGYLDKRLVLALFEHESGFKVNARNKGNYGLGQINLRSHSHVNKAKIVTDIDYAVIETIALLTSFRKDCNSNKDYINFYNSGSRNGASRKYVSTVLTKMKNYTSA